MNNTRNESIRYLIKSSRENNFIRGTVSTSTLLYPYSMDAVYSKEYYSLVVVIQTMKL